VSHGALATLAAKWGLKIPVFTEFPPNLTNVYFYHFVYEVAVKYSQTYKHSQSYHYPNLKQDNRAQRFLSDDVLYTIEI